MRDILVDIVAHSGDTGMFSSLLIEGDDEKTIISGIADDRSVVLQAELKEPNPNFVGTFGMTNLSLLKFYLNYSAYKSDNADIRTKTEERNGETVITEIVFADDTGDNTSTYRVADRRHVPPKPHMMAQKWLLDVTPSKEKIKEFEALGNGLGGLEKQFMPRTDDNKNLRFHIGDINAATHKANMVMQKDVEGVFTQQAYFITKSVVTALKLGVANENPAQLKLSEKALQVTVESEYATYTYVFLAMAKTSK